MLSPLGTAALQHRLIAGLCHCKYTYEVLLLVQVCSDQTPRHRRTAQGKMHSCHCKFTYGDLLFVQVCSDPTEMHCSTGLGKMHSPLFSSALQNRLTAGLCHCSYIYGDLLFRQACSDPAPMQTGSQHECIYWSMPVWTNFRPACRLWCNSSCCLGRLLSC